MVARPTIIPVTTQERPSLLGAKLTSAGLSTDHIGVLLVIAGTPVGAGPPMVKLAVNVTSYPTSRLTGAILHPNVFLES